MSTPSASQGYWERHRVNKELLISCSIRALHDLRGSLYLCVFLLSPVEYLERRSKEKVSGSTKGGAGCPWGEASEPLHKEQLTKTCRQEPIHLTNKERTPCHRKQKARASRQAGSKRTLRSLWVKGGQASRVDCAGFQG